MVVMDSSNREPDFAYIRGKIERKSSLSLKKLNFNCIFIAIARLYPFGYYATKREVIDNTVLIFLICANRLNLR